MVMSWKKGDPESEVAMEKTPSYHGKERLLGFGTSWVRQVFNNLHM